MITAKVQQSTDTFIQFTETQMAELGIKPDDKFSIECKDGGILLTPYKTIDIDLKDFDRPTLEALVAISCEKDISVNEVIEEILHQIVKSAKFLD